MQSEIIHTFCLTLLINYLNEARITQTLETAPEICAIKNVPASITFLR